ncbi:MAG: YfhO family protein [Acidobacteriia bacterium]|nr:YfhO family protein [Terriglobia bacterium]
MRLCYGVPAFSLMETHANPKPLVREQALAPRAFDRSDIGPLLLLVGCVLAMFWRAVFTPAMFFYRDVFNYSYPHARFIQQACRQGFLPYWNPYLNFGEPVLANPNFLFFYPSTLLLIALPIDLGYVLHYVLHYMLAAVGAYGLARRWGLSRAAAFFAGFIFAFNGPMLSLGNLYNHMAAAAWIPWALLLTDKAVRSSSRRPWILLAVVFALQFLAAEPFTLIATFALSLAYALFQDAATPTRSVRRVLVAFFFVGVLMVALAAVQLLPSLSLLSTSRRGIEGLPFNETTSWSFHPLHMLEMVIPNFFGSPISSATIWSLVLSNRNMPYYASLFVGFIPLFLALAGWALGKDRRRTFAGVAALVLLVLSFGRFTPVFAFVYLLLPPLALVRFPAKLLIPMLLLVSLLAGMGLDILRGPAPAWKDLRRRMVRPLAVLLGCVVIAWLAALLVPGLLDPPTQWMLIKTNKMFVRTPAGELTSAQAAEAAAYFLNMLRIMLPGLCGFALGALLWLGALERESRRAQRILPAIVALALGQMALANYPTNPTVPKSFYTYRPPVLDHFEPSHKPYRFAYIFREAQAPVTTPDVQGFLNFESIPQAADYSPAAQIALRDRLILSRGSMLLDIEGATNIDVEGSYPPYLFAFWVYAIRNLPDPALTACLLGRANVRYMIQRSREATSTLREVAPIFNGSSAPNYLYEDLCLVPRAFAAGGAVRFDSVADSLRLLADPAFDATGEVFLSPDSAGAPTASPAGPAGTVQIAVYRPNEVTLSARLSRAGYVTLLDRFDPGWHARIDGQEVRVFRVHQLFRAVYCREGEHVVRFYYQQPGLRAGLILSIVTLAGLAAAYVAAPRGHSQG